MTLFDGMTYPFHWTITKQPAPDHVHISPLRLLPSSEAQPDWAVDLQARFHPRGIRYPAPAAVRALVHAQERQGSTITGFSALSLFDLPYLVEGHDTTLSAPVASTLTGDALHPTVVRRQSMETWTVNVRGFPFRVASPPAATIQALKLIRRGQVAWPTVSGLDARTTRAIQLIDAVRRHLGVSPDQLRRAGHYHLNARWLEGLLKVSSALADSPKETEMRLLLRSVTEKFGLELREQVPVYLSGRLVTIFDFALPQARIGLMYDGQHHWEYKQRQKDSSINLDVTALGWTPLRFTAGTLPELPQRLGYLLSAKSDRA